ncbi:hypothetical protein C6Y14_04550 [Streptomyces dioscori]|uniref:Uncharacterized protein n=1 Tax=Streptomyces dioscori TaxID=2109333 RepID=A0A2P8QGD7_9ACTN|nr:hypothetical protein [Streptomyces dioscori]PSM45325.1 hypothetical protein C6Y14_04550 [Streptomyces dioscori]
MDTAAGPGLGTEAPRRGTEGQDATAVLSPYAGDAGDAEPRVVDGGDGDGDGGDGDGDGGDGDGGRVVEQTVLRARNAVLQTRDAEE